MESPITGTEGNKEFLLYGIRDGRADDQPVSTLFAKSVGVFAKPNPPQAAKLVPQLIQWLKQREIGSPSG